jgi:hypothetical protein
MIIFNLWAIPVAIVIFGLIAGLNHFFPTLTSDSYFPYTLGAAMAVVGGIAEWFGIKARVFFLPIWLIGIGAICYKLGPVGWVLLGLIAVACIIFVVRWTKKMTAEEWRKAEEELVKSPNPPMTKEREFWSWVETTLHFPLGSPTAEQCAHDLRVLQSIKKARPYLTSADAAGFVALEMFFEKNKNEAKCPAIDNRVQTAISNVIKQKMKKAKPETPFQALPNPASEAVAS